ncbi:MAG: hypothetical protein HY253_06955 [Burkholderiales bacterium]|nr:hypothetical protein [Burkholderiales bacterium]
MSIFVFSNFPDKEATEAPDTPLETSEPPPDREQATTAKTQAAIKTNLRIETPIIGKRNSL